ncbi:hypothetical protein [Desulfonatronospira sp.]|uniref:hypothetical protein n=1 Tax=Desulfonatronospira sp. TaxID=1962951 RepID=UPI0025B933B9|nr:hypothetical protein [Desulfonatronospira sp.]
MNRFLPWACTAAVVVFVFALSMDISADNSKAGENLVNHHCDSCHGLDRVQAARKTLEEWESTVQRMMNYGAGIDGEEKQLIVEYLAEH